MFKLLLGLLLLSSAGVFAVEKDKSVEKWSSLDEQLDLDRVTPICQRFALDIQ